MSAEDHLSPRLFHGSDEDFNVGDEIHPGAVAGNSKFTAEASGHREFVWMSPHEKNASFFGRKVYQVEPQGLTNKYTYPTPTHPADEDAHVSLAPVKVVRKGRALRGDNSYNYSRNEVRWEDEKGNN